MYIYIYIYIYIYVCISLRLTHNIYESKTNTKRTGSSLITLHTGNLHRWLLNNEVAST